MESEGNKSLAYLSSEKFQNTHCLFFPATWKQAHWLIQAIFSHNKVKNKII